MNWSILAENNDWVAVDKGAGLLSIPDRQGKEVSLKDLLKQRYGEIYTVHRIDRDTSGIILFAKTAETHQALSKLFEERSVDKFYECLVRGYPSSASGTIQVPIMENPAQPGRMMTHARGKEAVTEYQVTEIFRGFSLLRCRILTGRTHQIRVHLQNIGHSIVGDEWYGDGSPLLLSSIKKNFKISIAAEEERPILSRLALHAAELSFEWKNQPVQLIAPLPKDMRATLQQLRKWAPASGTITKKPR
jgi:23S rRNA pseudouridine955/2504/2580 synthase/23S rRNA pseudouridine1911/1915/1917 synthase